MLDTADEMLKPCTFCQRLLFPRFLKAAKSNE